LLSDDKPDVAYSDIGGMDIQKQEVREAVELPLTHFELYKQIGIDPPRGVLMFGPPGCGKTMLAKAVAHHTTGRYLQPPTSQPSHCTSTRLPRLMHSPGIVFVKFPGPGKSWQMSFFLESPGNLSARLHPQTPKYPALSCMYGTHNNNNTFLTSLCPGLPR